ncbi:MAG: hypothetical protein C4533_07225 [Candidatus Omnitrophota bacterium]|jgi:glycosyltransferase involved in cell wall biosynthesis|nr:MAG: hypothetical protein C4533_07225 [Candidatus Omnitrophota bacterium]
MDIGYLAYLDPFVFGGGGEMVMREVLTFGKNAGHKIDLYCVKGQKIRKADFLANKDLFILADIFNCYTHPHFYSWGLLSELISRQKYIHFDNAYVEICNLGYLPCCGQTGYDNCVYKREGKFKRFLATAYKLGIGNAVHDLNGCFRLNTRWLYRESKLNIFVSPLHRNIALKMLGQDVIDPSYVMKPIVDTRRFRDMQETRDIENLYIGPLNEAKGIENIRNLFPGGDITLIGDIGEERYRQYGDYIGHVAYSEIHKYFNRAKNFVFLPEWPEPMGRVVIEAALCGCNLITNDNVGALSFNFDIRDPSNFDNVLEEIWDMIEGII